MDVVYVLYLSICWMYDGDDDNDETADLDHFAYNFTRTTLNSKVGTVKKRVRHLINPCNLKNDMFQLDQKNTF